MGGRVNGWIVHGSATGRRYNDVIRSAAQWAAGQTTGLYMGRPLADATVRPNSIYPRSICAGYPRCNSKFVRIPVRYG